MNITYRRYDYDGIDYRAVAHVARAVDPVHAESEAELREYDTVARTAGRISTWWLAIVDDQVVGTAHISVAPYQPADRIFHDIGVHPEWQRRGIGRELLSRAEQVAHEAGRTVITTTTSERFPRAMRMLEAAGYRQADSRWESVLDLTAWDPAEFTSAVDALEPMGITVRSVSDLAASEKPWLEQLHQLYVTLENDVPQPTPLDPTPLPEFEALTIRSEAALPDAFLVAVEGETFVGLTEAARPPDHPHTLAQRLTGVRADHRHRGIATALKVLVLTWAKENGFAEVRTQNGVQNQAMLGINERLGFELAAIDFLYMKELD